MAIRDLSDHISSLLGHNSKDVYSGDFRSAAKIKNMRLIVIGQPHLFFITILLL